MRIIHTADWHLCDRLGRIDRTTDLKTRKSASVSMGLSRKAVAPSEVARRRNSSSPKALMTTTGVSQPRSRTFCKSCSPVMTGMRM